MNNDAYQTVAPNPKGEHVEQCMKDTLKGRTPGLINVHATSTPMGDYAELDAINRLGLQDVPICANKSQLGHLMGAAGAVELAVSIMSLKHAIIPPTVNVEEVSEGYSPNIRSKSEPHQISSVLCNSFGFGGTNASILIS
jgi:3-oxoacyl-[acyl-carrier-protein] synthase II